MFQNMRVFLIKFQMIDYEDKHLHESQEIMMETLSYRITDQLKINQTTIIILLVIGLALNFYLEALIIIGLDKLSKYKKK